MTPYNAGKEAATQGKEFWENPHSVHDGNPVYFLAWFAGWCSVKKLMDRVTQ